MMGIEKTEKYGSDSDTVPRVVPAHDVESGETTGLKRELKGRHMQMIAIGGSIGAGLFVGSGSALNSGGPASLVIDFLIIGFMLLLTVNALGELASKSCASSMNPNTNIPQLFTLSLVPSTTTLFDSSTPDGDSPWAGTMR